LPGIAVYRKTCRRRIGRAPLNFHIKRDTTSYAVAGALLILARYFGVGLLAVQWAVDVDNTPIRALGVVSMGIFAGGYILVALVRWLVSG